MGEPRRYSLPEPMVQAIVNVLNELPAGHVRPLLNAIEAECLQQDQALPPVQTSARDSGKGRGALQK
jgi:hypothetical protein